MMRRGSKELCRKKKIMRARGGSSRGESGFTGTGDHQVRRTPSRDLPKRDPGVLCGGNVYKEFKFQKSSSLSWGPGHEKGTRKKKPFLIKPHPNNVRPVESSYIRKREREIFVRETSPNPQHGA